MGKEMLLPATIIGKLPLPKNLSLPFPPIPIDVVITEIIDYIKVREREITRRKWIETLRIAIEKFIETYSENFDKIFDEKVRERTLILHVLLTGIEQALKKGNEKQLKLLLQSLIGFLNSPVISDDEYKAILGEAMENLLGKRGEEDDNNHLPRQIEW